MNIIVVDDDRECLESLASALRLEGYRVREFAAPIPALEQFDPESTDIVITDYDMPGMTGLDLLNAIHQKKQRAPVIIISGESHKNIKSLCVKAGASAFFYKPLNIKQVIAKMKKLVM